jgi:hypothetical protein
MLDLSIPVSTGAASTIGAMTLAGTWLLKRFVLQKMDPTMLACIGGTLATIAAAFGTNMTIGAAVASGVAGTAGAGLVYDKVANPVVGRLWDWMTSRFPKGK